MTLDLEPLSVCVVTQQLRTIVSGIGLHAGNLVSRLLRDGHQVCVLAPADQRPSGDLDFRFIAVPRPLFSGSQARWISLAFSFRLALKKLGSPAPFDIIHFTDLRESLLCEPHPRMVGNANDTYAAELRSLAYYRDHYSDWPQRWLYYRFVHACEKKAVSRLAAVLANSHYTASAFQQQYGPDPRKLFVVHKSIDPRLFLKVRNSRRDGSPQSPVVLFIGGNMQRKGLPDLIAAAPSVLDQLPSAEFWVVGRDSAEAEMKKLCVDKGVERRFRFLGGKTQSELADLYARASVFCMPSLTEAFGVVFLEAMSAGVPVLGSRVGGVPEIIQEQSNGLLVEPDNPTELAQKLLRLLKDAPLRERLRQAGYQTVEQFTVDRMMAGTYAVYRQVMDADPA